MARATMHLRLTEIYYRMMISNKTFASVLFTIAILLANTLSAKVLQHPQMLTVNNYAVFAQRESEVLKTKYHLSVKQYAATQYANNWFYLNMAKAFADCKLPADRKQRITVLGNKHETDLKSIFSATQFAQYTKDRLALGIIVKRRIDSLNKLQKFRAVSASNNAH